LNTHQVRQTELFATHTADLKLLLTLLMESLITKIIMVVAERFQMATHNG